MACGRDNSLLLLEPMELLRAVGCRRAVHGAHDGAAGYLRARRAGRLLTLAVLLVACGPTGTTDPGVPSGGAGLGAVWGQVTLWPCAGGAEPVDNPCRGKPLAGAKVDFTPAGGGGPEVATTDAEGLYRIALKPGDYTVRVESRVFNVSDPGGTRRVTVPMGDTVKLDLVLDSGVR